MKKFYFQLNEFNPKVLSVAIEAGCDAIVTSGKNINEVKAMSVVPVISEDESADMVIGRDVADVLISGQADENAVVLQGGKIPTIIRNLDWTVIPLENLISKTRNLIQHVRTAQQAGLVLEIMERGADGVLLETTDIDEIKKTAVLVRQADNERLGLETAKVVEVVSKGLGERVIVDTLTSMREGQGMLVGNSTSMMFLVHNENVENRYVGARPFRVNAGGVHAYIRLPGDKTKYLSELKAGEKAFLVDHLGNSEPALIGRVKIERRPMLMVTAEVNGVRGSLLLQNAETIRLTTPTGSYVSVTGLRSGDEILVYREEAGYGRHFGQKLTETIREQ